jgi:hypothetical protein
MSIALEIWDLDDQPLTNRALVTDFDVSLNEFGMEFRARSIEVPVEVIRTGWPKWVAYFADLASETPAFLFPVVRPSDFLYPGNAHFAWNASNHVFTFVSYDWLAKASPDIRVMP